MVDHEEETRPEGCLFPEGQSVAPGPQGACRINSRKRAWQRPRLAIPPRRDAMTMF